MAEISARLVKELREKTGAGMMDCKAALAESAGDIEAAVDWLRKKGLAKAAKKAGRVAAEGLIGLAHRGKQAVLVEVNSETDFVARNEQFQALVKSIAEIAAEVGVDVDRIKAAKLGGATVADAIASAIATIGENLTLRRAGMLAVGEGAIGSYMHASVDTEQTLGRIGALVALESKGTAEVLAEFGRKVAMHVAATNPQAIDASGLDPAVVSREREVLADKARASGKPDSVIEKIVESGLRTFYKEVCLLDQPFVHEPAKSVAQALKEAEGRAGAPIRISGFLRYALGEGIEKPEQDFAAEVAAAAKSG